jgi:hypothetical protein
MIIENIKFRLQAADTSAALVIQCCLNHKNKMPQINCVKIILETME